MQNSSKRAKYLLKNTVVIAIGNFASKFISFFLVPLYTNVLSTSDYGTVDLINTLCIVIAPMLICNIGDAVVRFSLDRNCEKKVIMSIGVLILGIASIIGLAVIPISNISSELSPYRYYIYLYTISYAATQLFLSYLKGKEMLVEFSVGNIIHTFGIAAFNILALVVFHMGIDGYFIAYICANLVTVIYACVVGKIRDILTGFSFDGKTAKSMVLYSVVLFPNTFMWWIVNSSDRIMITAMIGTAANGIYAAAYKLPSLIQTITSIFNQAWGFSAIKENDSSDRDQYTQKIYQGFVAVVSISGVLLLLVTKPFMKIYVSSSFYEAWKYMPYLIVGYVFMTIGTFIATPYYVNKDSKGYLLSGTAGAVVNIGLNAVLIPAIGVHGAALATCLSYIVVFIYRTIDTRKYQKLEVFNRTDIIGYIILVGAAAMTAIDNLWLCETLLLILVVILVTLHYSKVRPFVSAILKKVRKG